MLPCRGAPTQDENAAAGLEAVRRLARLEHPRLERPTEVGLLAGQVYVACELRPGVQLFGDWIQSLQTPAGPADVVGWCCDVLDALAGIHEAGLLHGDLGMHCLLVDRQGHVLLWGGMAPVREAQPVRHDAASPPLPAHRQAVQRELFAAGLLLHQWLTGEPVQREPDLPTNVNRLFDQGLRLPRERSRLLPSALVSIVDRATDSVVPRRYLGARSLLRALEGWRQSAGAGAAGPLVLIIERLRKVGHLPAMPGLTRRVASLGQAETRSIPDLSDSILEDPALTFELLRQANTSAHGGRDEGPVTSVKRSIQLLGTNGVRRAAAVLRPWPGPLQQDQARALELVVHRARWAGHVARILGPVGLDPDSLFLAAELQFLGRLLLHYHFPSEAVQVMDLMRPAPSAEVPGTLLPGLDESAAATAVLGTDLTALAAAVLRHWGVGDALAAMVRPLDRLHPVRVPADADGWVHLVASCAIEALDAQGPNRVGGRVPALDQVAARYARTLGLQTVDLRSALERGKLLVQRQLQIERAA